MTRHRLFCAALASSMTTLAVAQSTPYYVGASQTFSHHSNLYRLGDDDTLQPGQSKSDTISSTGLVGGIDQSIGRQRIYGNGTVRENRFNNNKDLNNQSYALTAAIDWETIERISGSVTVTADRDLRTFNDTRVNGATETRPNQESTRQIDAVARIGMVTRLTVEAAASHRAVDFSDPGFRSSEYRQDAGSIGMRYRPGAATTFGAALRLTNGKYPRFRQQSDGSFQADRFDRRDLDLTTVWIPNDISTVRARVSLGKTDYELANQRDFSGVTGSLVWDWRPLGKLRFNTRLSRETGQDTSFIVLENGTAADADYSRTANVLRIAGDYDATAKIALTTALTYARRNLVPTGVAAQQLAAGRDDTTSLSLGARWVPLRSVQVGCEVAGERRSTGTSLSSDLRGTTYSCYGQLTLQL